MVDASDFDADAGGTLAIGGATYTYTVDDVDDGTLTLGSGLAADAAEGDRVDIWDTAVDAASVQYRADVQLPNTIDGGDTADARLAAALVPQFTHKLGLRAIGTCESCVMELQDDWVVVEIVGGIVQVDGGAIAPATLPQAALGFTLPSGSKVTVAASAPSTPATGDVWIDTSSGNTLNQWDGSDWNAIQFGTDAIAAGSITTAQLAAEAVEASNIAAGTVFAGIVDATTISGAPLDATGTAGDILVYDGTPGAGNLMLSISPAAGTDTFGNDYPAGIGVFNESLSATTVASLVLSDLLSATASQIVTFADGGTDTSVLKIGGPKWASGSDDAASITLESRGSEPAGAQSFVTLNGSEIEVNADTALQINGDTFLDGKLAIGAGPEGKYYAIQGTFSRASTASGSATTLGAASLTTVHESSDYTSPWSSGTFTAPVAGFYDVAGYIAGVTGAARTSIVLLKNGSEACGGDTAAGGAGRASFARTVWLAAGDTLQFQVFQNGGSSVTVTGNFSVCRRL